MNGSQTKAKFFATISKNLTLLAVAALAAPVIACPEHTKANPIVLASAGTAGTASALASSPAATQTNTSQTANEFVEQFSNNILNEIKTRKAELSGDPGKLNALVDQKVMPNVNFRKMTQLVVGRPWREATPAQREAISAEFKKLLTKTYSGALSQVGDQTLQVDKLRAKPNETDVVVTSRVLQKNGPPVDLAYRVEQKDGQWKVYDLSVMGLWLVDSYRAQFSPVIAQSGIDGLIANLKAKNNS